MARGKGRSGRRYVRDAKGRFASTGYVGQTGGRGARLKSAGKKREGGGEKVKISSTKQSGIIRRSSKKTTAAKTPQVSSARQAATDRLKIKTQTRRAIRADRASVITPGQRSRLETGKGATIKSARPKATVAKPRTKGNKPATVARRVDRKAAVNQANIRNIIQKERTGATQGRQYQRALKTQATLKRAQEFTKTGKLPGRDNSIKAQRERKAASQRLAAKNAERKAARQRGDTASVNVPMSGSRGRQSASKKPIAKTSKAPVNKAKTAYKRARADARMRNADLRGADVNERRMANTAAAKVKNMQRRRSASVPKASADSPKSRQTAKEYARRKRAAANERQAYDRWDKGIATDKDSRKASVAKRARAIYEGKIDPKVKTRARLTQTRNPDVLRDRIKRGEKLTAAKAKKAASKRRKRK